MRFSFSGGPWWLVCAVLVLGECSRSRLICALRVPDGIYRGSGLTAAEIGHCESIACREEASGKTHRIFLSDNVLTHRPSIRLVLSKQSFRHDSLER